MPHPWTFTPVVASLLFFGARGSRRQLWAPWLLLAASDVVLTKLVYAYPFFTWDHYVTWAWYAAILWLGTKLRKDTKPLHVIGVALASSVSFYLISNFDVWAARSEEHTSELQSLTNLVCRLLLEKKKDKCVS